MSCLPGGVTKAERSDSDLGMTMSQDLSADFDSPDGARLITGYVCV